MPFFVQFEANNRRTVARRLAPAWYMVVNEYAKFACMSVNRASVDFLFRYFDYSDLFKRFDTEISNKQRASAFATSVSSGDT